MNKLEESEYSNSAVNFPQKLFTLLEQDNGVHVQWCDHGLCFRICDPETFANEIVPKYFKRKLLINRFKT